jgi:hypothetical protein
MLANIKKIESASDPQEALGLLRFTLEKAATQQQ